MAVHMGIQCDGCGRVYFIARTDRIEFSSSNLDGRYKLTCVLPCKAVRYFTREEMQPYSVSTSCYERGYADRGQYQVLRLAS